MASPLLPLALAACLQSPVMAAKPWQPVISQEGQFSVEMPARPNTQSSHMQNGAGGRLQVVTIGCETKSGAYQVHKVEFPTALVRGAEDAQLNDQRDYFALLFNGKVISEKRTTLMGRPGRDFVIRGEEPGLGVVTVRAREFVAGKAVFVLLVAANANRELPEDAGRFLGSLELGTKREKVDPKVARKNQVGKPIAGWGTAFNPDNDCTIKPDGKDLTVEVPGKPHGFHPEYNAPRVIRDVEGDFLATVKVEGTFQPGGTSTNAKTVPFNGAGLVVWNDAENYIRLERAAILRGGKVTTYAMLEELEGGHQGASHSGPLPPGTAYLRIERRGGRIVAGISPDGAQWKTLRPIDVSYPPKLKVGVAAVNSSTLPMTVKFVDFTLKGNQP